MCVGEGHDAEHLGPSRYLLIILDLSSSFMDTQQKRPLWCRYLREQKCIPRVEAPRWVGEGQSPGPLGRQGCGNEGSSQHRASGRAGHPSVAPTRALSRGLSHRAEDADKEQRFWKAARGCGAEAVALLTDEPRGCPCSRLRPPLTLVTRVLPCGPRSRELISLLGLGTEWASILSPEPLSQHTHIALPCAAVRAEGNQNPLLENSPKGSVSPSLLGPHTLYPTPLSFLLFPSPCLSSAPLSSVVRP